MHAVLCSKSLCILNQYVKYRHIFFLKEMKEQEQEHLETFNKLIVEKRVRPTALLPLWNIAGFALGTNI